MLRYKTILKSLWINMTRLQEHYKYKHFNTDFRIMIDSWDEGKGRITARSECQSRMIFKAKIKVLNGLEQELANVFGKDQKVNILGLQAKRQSQEYNVGTLLGFKVSASITKIDFKCLLFFFFQLFKNAETILSLQAIRKQVVCQIWPMVQLNFL